MDEVVRWFGFDDFVKLLTWRVVLVFHVWQVALIFKTKNKRLKKNFSRLSLCLFSSLSLYLVFSFSFILFSSLFAPFSFQTKKHLFYSLKDFEFSSCWKSIWEWEGLKVGNGVGVEVGVGVRSSDLREKKSTN